MTTNITGKDGHGNKRELHTGTAGNGDRVWILITTHPSGRDGRDTAVRFNTKAEAMHWMEWC